MEDVLIKLWQRLFQTKHLIIENLIGALLFVQKRKLYNFYRKFYKTCSNLIIHLYL
jgi:hypothetical protein